MLNRYVINIQLTNTLLVWVLFGTLEGAISMLLLEPLQVPYGTLYGAHFEPL